MISKYDQRQSGHTLTLVFIPRQDRAATDGRRLPARVIAKLHGSRYLLQTEYGVLKHHYGARHLEKVPNGILSTITDNPAVITLQAAAKTASRIPCLIYPSRSLISILTHSTWFVAADSTTSPTRMAVNCASATSFQLQCARVDPVGLRDAALAAARKVITAGLSVIVERIPFGTFSRCRAP